MHVAISHSYWKVSEDAVCLWKRTSKDAGILLAKVIARVAKVFRINSTHKAINSTQLHLILFQLHYTYY